MIQPEYNKAIAAPFQKKGDKKIKAYSATQIQLTQKQVSYNSELILSKKIIFTINFHLSQTDGLIIPFKNNKLKNTRIINTQMTSDFLTKNQPLIQKNCHRCIWYNFVNNHSVNNNSTVSVIDLHLSRQSENTN